MHYRAEAMPERMVGRSRSTVTPPVVAIIWKLSRLGRLRMTTFLYNSRSIAQLYQDKDSDCWIFVYIIHNLAPDLHYKKKFVIPAGFIPGPEKMKDSDSFLYPVLYHISVLQNEGLRIWDASTQSHISHSTPFVFVTADGPTMAMVSGMVGHSGKYGCRLYCGLPGRR
jgi:Transposase family tnp2